VESVYIGIGSNLGDKLRNCSDALSRLSINSSCTIDMHSGFYRTEPFGFREQPWFINAVAKVSTSLDPPDLLKLCKEIEDGLGRRNTVRWGPRIIDLDILLWPDRIWISRDLQIPHPGLHLRRFVLKPFSDIAPSEIHPLLGIPINELLEKLSDSDRVEQLPVAWRKE
jgi:2-amino-4-hydroxy-6-hydroxymethyldihydropteridine diphosphokinase